MSAPVAAKSRALALALPAATGALLAASTPPALAPVVPFVALVPLALWTTRLPSGPRGALAAAAGGALAGALQHAWGLRWLPGTLVAVAGPAVGWISAVAVIAVLAACTSAAACALHALLTGRRPLPVAVAVPVVWTALEWGLAHLPFGWAFPWAPLALGLTRWPATLGVAELVGVTGVGAWIAAVNGLAAEAALRAQAAQGRSRALAPIAAALAVVLLPVAGGVVRARTLDAQVVGRVAALAVPLPHDAPPALRADRATDLTDHALAALPVGSVDLIVLPEMALPFDPDSEEAAQFRLRLETSAARVGASLLVGTLGVDERGVHNSALLLGAAPDAPAFRADKRRLVPGVERASAVRAPWLAPGASGYAPGSGWPVARVGDLGVGALICFEVAFPDDARRLVGGGARALAALTSDAWFGAGGARAAGLEQQVAHLVMRAVETRTGAVRASSGGPAAIVAPTGAVEAATAEGLVTGVVRSAAPTLFVRTGDWVGPAAALALVLLLVFA